MVDDGDFACVNAKFDHCSLQQLLAARSSLTRNLGKVSQLRDRLTTSEKRLRGMVHRLPLLEEIMAPLQDRASVTNCLSSRIDEALKGAASVLHIFKAIQAIEKNLKEDPKTDLRKYVGVVCCLERYMQMLHESYEPSLNWLEDVVVFLEQTRAVDRYGLQKLTDMLAESRHRNPRTEMLKVDGGLLHNALQKLETEFERLVVQHSSPMDLNLFLNDETDSQPFVTELSFSPVVIGNLLVIMDRLKANGRLQGCFRIYKESRARTVRKGMSSLAPVYLQYYSEDAVDKIKWEQIHDYIFSWVQHLKVIVKVAITHERELCHQVFQILDPSEWEKCLQEILQLSNLSSFFRFSEAVARSHHRPEALLIGLLDLFKGIEDVIEDTREVLESEGCLSLLSNLREAQKPLVNNAWRVFLEFVKNVDKSQASVPKDGGKDMNASFVVNYLGMLMRDYGTVLEHVMGAQTGGVQQQQSSNLSVVMLRVMSSLERSLESRAARFEEAALAHIFLMNNYRHVLVRLKECATLTDCLGAVWRTDWQRKVDQNLRNYVRKAWEKVLQHLSRDGLLSSSGSRFSSLMRDMVKSKLRAFNTAFEDAYNKQCKWVILDPQLRETARIEVTQLLIPAYRSFLKAFGCPEEEAAASHKSIKYTPDLLQTKLDDLFEGSKPGSIDRSF